MRMIQQRSSSFFALLFLGVATILIGLIYGFGSRQIVYQTVGQDTIAHYLSLDATGYLQMTSNSTIYIVNEKNFLPIIKGASTLQDGDTISLVYDLSDTTDIDVQSKLGTHLVGTAYKVVEITFVDNSNHQIFAMGEYTQHPQGYHDNRWESGIALVIVGVLMVVGAFFFPRKKVKLRNY